MQEEKSRAGLSECSDVIVKLSNPSGKQEANLIGCGDRLNVEKEEA